VTTDGLLEPDELDDLVTLRRRLHQSPECGFDVGGTARTVADALSDAGLDVVTGVGGAGVVGTLRGDRDAPRAIGLRADLDALPIAELTGVPHASQRAGRFHGCGHDGHTAMLVGAARTLARRRDELAGHVHLVFQPDEENGRGAAAMIDDGLFQRFPLDAIFGLHNLPGLAVGSFATRIGALAAFEEGFTIEIRGRGGHASSPHVTVDPLPVGAAVVTALQSIVARSVAPHRHAVVSVTEFITDGARNVLPSTVLLRGDVRGYDEEVSDTVRRRMTEIATGVAATYGASATVTYQRDFEPTVNTADGAEAVARAVAGIAGARTDVDCARVGFSEDFGRYLHHRPGCLVLMGNGTEGRHGHTLHSPTYEFNDAALPYGVAFWTGLALGELAP
jgi:amidohydrolase